MKRQYKYIPLIVVATAVMGLKTPILQGQEWTESELSWSPGAATAGWSGWWFRYGTEWFQFTFTGIDTDLIDNYVTVEFHLRITNRSSGEAGLDGLVDVVINPGLAPTTTYTNVLLDNVDPSNLVYSMGTGGSYGTNASLDVPKSYIVGGQLVVRVLRHPDTGGGPVAPVGTEQPIDISTSPPTVPPGVYEGDDAHTIHIGVTCEDGAGGHVIDGVVVVMSDRVGQACCFWDGCCQNLEPADCLTQGGEPQGSQTSCETTTCAVPSGDCTDQECSTAGGGRSIHYFMPMGQEFVPSSRNHRGIDLYLWENSPGPVTVRLHEGTIDGAVVPNSTVTLTPDGGGWVPFIFEDLVCLNPGETYVVEAVTDAPSWSWAYTSDSCYPQGTAILSGSPSGSDQCFRTWVACVDDVTPPEPDPMVFSSSPAAVTSSEITMSAALATDSESPPVYYHFWTDPVEGGHSSSWQLDRTYTDSGLDPNTQYMYRVYARDSAPTPNQTAFTSEGTYTLANTPAAPLLSNPTDNTMDLNVDPNGNPGSTEFAVQCTATNPGDGTWTDKWINAAGSPSGSEVWQTASSWGMTTILGLAGSTDYTFAVKARNADLIETVLGPTTTETTTGGVFSVGGAIYTDCENPLTSGLADAQVTVDGPGGTFVTTTSGSQGIWQVDDVPCGTYTVTPSLTSCEFCHIALPDYDCPPDPCSSSCQITVDESHQAENQSIQFLADCDCHYTIGGAIYTDCDEPLTSGLADAQVTVDGPGGTFVTTTSGSQGIWQLDDVPCGTYTITPSLASCGFCHIALPDYDCPPDPCSSSCQITVDESHQAENQSIQFLADCDCHYTIGGAIYADCDEPLTSGETGVEVTVDDGLGGTFVTTTSGDQGLWQLDDVPCGTYTVMPEKSGLYFCHVTPPGYDCPPAPCNPSCQIIVDGAHQAENRSTQFLVLEDGTGACCFSTGGCLDLAGSDCDMAGGYGSGPGTSCADPGVCTGACCLSSGGCLGLTESDCGVIPETAWMGFGTDCSDSNENGTADACECCPGDMNCDGTVDMLDVEPFVLALIDPVAFAGQYPDYDIDIADANTDGAIDSLDVQPFVNVFLTPP